MYRLLVILATIILLSAACTAVGREPEAVPAPTAVAAGVTSAETFAAPITESPAPTTVSATSTPTAEPTKVAASLPNLGPAPAWANDTWINSDPLTLADLRGKVVLLEFWTFG